MTAIAAVIVALIAMAAEQRRSRTNERELRAHGAIEPADDVYQTMAWAYPATFVAMAVEGIAAPIRMPMTVGAGVTLFVLAKALKFWAIASLGPRWTFRVLVPPGSPLVSHGPYAVVRHPNYVAVVGEIIGFALLVGAPITGAASLVGFGLLLRRRIAVEEAALGR